MVPIFRIIWVKIFVIHNVRYKKADCIIAIGLKILLGLDYIHIIFNNNSLSRAFSTLIIVCMLARVVSASKREI